MHLDDLVESIGSFGKFQFLVICMVMLPKMSIGYSMLIMTFGGFIPDWWCISSNTTQPYSNTTYKNCNNSLEGTCSHVYDVVVKTVVSEYDLVCGRKWITPTITSIQFGGVLLGALIGGQAADTFGRKKTFYSSLLLHSAFSILIIVSPNWQVFAGFRFIIGSSIGCYLVVSMFPVEFLGFKWRPCLTAVPFWATGVCFLALSSWLLQDWKYVHIVVGVSTIPFLLGWFIVPESIRWLTVKGKLDEAEQVIEMVVSLNDTKKPEDTRNILEKIREEEISNTKGGKQYSYIDIYKGKILAKRSIVMQIIWWCVSASYYGFAFGVGKFSGNFYLNLFLMNVLEFPFFIPLIFALNKLGRKFVATSTLGLGAASCLAVIIVQATVGKTVGYRGSVITALSLSARIFVGQAWAALIAQTNEMYPTVIRNLGYGAANMASRVGGIVAPFVFGGSDDEMIPYIIVVSILSISAALSQIFLPETLGAALEDILPGQDKDNKKEKALNQKENKEMNGDSEFTEF